METVFLNLCRIFCLDFVSKDFQYLDDRASLKILIRNQDAHCKSKILIIAFL